MKTEDESDWAPRKADANGPAAKLPTNFLFATTPDRVRTVRTKTAASRPRVTMYARYSSNNHLPGLLRLQKAFSDRSISYVVVERRARQTSLYAAMVFYEPKECDAAEGSENRHGD